MQQVVTQLEQWTQYVTKLSLQESTVSTFTDELDPCGWIFNKMDKERNSNGTLISLNNEKGEREVAAIVIPAEESQFQTLTLLNKAKLTNSIYLSAIWISKDAVMSEVLPAILYFALRRGRILGRKNIVSLVKMHSVDASIVAYLQLNHLEHVEQIQLNNEIVAPVAQQLNYSLHLIYQHCRREHLTLIQESFIDEILETHRNWLDRFYRGPWCRAVIQGSLSKEQYISSLFNLHQYVRQTTRLAARCVAHSDDPYLRNHYIKHFTGEINHELIIENDLKKLRADVNYLKHSHVPLPGTKEFMVVQESVIGYYQDPILMLACPLTAEGVSANMSSDFLEKLYQVIETWGIDDPKSAARFLSSHVNTDGGDDGHWNNLVKVLKKYILDERIAQKFLCVLTVAMNGFERSLNSNIEELELWSKTSVIDTNHEK